MAGTTSKTAHTERWSRWWRVATWVSEAMPDTLRDGPGRVARRVRALTTRTAPPPGPADRAPTLAAAVERLSTSLDQLAASALAVETAADEVVGQAVAAADPSGRRVVMAADQAHFVTMFWQICRRDDETGLAARQRLRRQLFPSSLSDPQSAAARWLADLDPGGAGELPAAGAPEPVEVTAGKGG
jgi:hypothetical protein